MNTIVSMVITTVSMVITFLFVWTLIEKYQGLERLTSAILLALIIVGAGRLSFLSLLYIAIEIVYFKRYGLKALLQDLINDSEYAALLIVLIIWQLPSLAKSLGIASGVVNVVVSVLHELGRGLP